MKRQGTMADKAFEVLGYGREMGLMHLQVDELDGRNIVLGDGQRLLQFGSCSYLGLETHPKLTEGALAAMKRFGTQLSSSRSYLCISILPELEARLSRELFNGYPVVVSNSVTSIHAAAIPALVQPNHAVVLDERAHASMHQAVDHVVRQSRVTTEIVPHNRIDLLREKIRTLNDGHEAIWFCCESVYSMWGDDIPFGELLKLLNEEPRLRLYIDDAHGMSWTGVNGSGRAFTLLDGDLRDRVALVVALGKSFGSGGAAIVLPRKESADRVCVAGPPLIFSHPPQPSMLGAGHASLDIHVSEEGAALRAQLDMLMRHARETLKEEGLPSFLTNTGPINFVPVGIPHHTFLILRKMMQDGYFLDGAVFPAVPTKLGGIRFTITNHLTKDDITAMIRCLARHYWETLAEVGLTINDIRSAFGALERDGHPPASARLSVAAPAALPLETHDSIAAFRADEWDGMFNGKVPLDHRNLRLFEAATATTGEVDAVRWAYRYFMVRDESGVPIVATWCTAALMKSDFLAPAETSEKIEQRREKDPLFLTERMVMLGSQCSYGDHLYVRTEHPRWEEALKTVIDGIWRFQTEVDANAVALRDFNADMDERVAKKLFELGFSRQILPDYFRLDLTWKDTDEMISRINRKYSRKQMRGIMKDAVRYAVDVTRDHPGEAGGSACYEMYLNVQRKARIFNMFPMQPTFMEPMYADPQWDLLRLYPLADDGSRLPAVAFVTGTLTPNGTYVLFMVGMDYDRLPEGAYDQMLLQGILHAKSTGATRVELGYTADHNKRRTGAERIGKTSFVWLRDHENAMAISVM
ncbi:MAG: hypothetical protein RLZZ324_502 [Candidatus Parcubacteria bacterium]